MNRTELSAAIANDHNLSKKAADDIVRSIFEKITASLAAGEAVVIPAFGTFDTAQRAAREGRNPRTGETLQIAAARVPQFRAGTSLKEAVKQS